MKGFKAAILALIGLCASATAACQTASTDPRTQVQAVEADGYRLGSGDEIKVTVFGEPGLSGPKVVNGQGAVAMDLIDAVMVKDLTLREAQIAIETRYKDGYINNPRVSIELTKGRPYYIAGEVNNPGAYPFTAGMTVWNAITTAGDFTYRANKRVIMITSADTGVEREVQLTPTTLVRPGDRIRIRERLF
jgi:protein involved in polysaccharide export with SLBB domain